MGRTKDYRWLRGFKKQIGQSCRGLRHGSSPTMHPLCPGVCRFRGACYCYDPLSPDPSLTPSQIPEGCPDVKFGADGEDFLVDGELRVVMRVVGAGGGVVDPDE